MKRTLTRNWDRVRTPDGRIYYVTHVSEFFMVQVWRERASWFWVACGFIHDESKPVVNAVPLIAKHGSGGTMNEAQWQAEQWLPPTPGEQLLWLQ